MSAYSSALCRDLQQTAQEQNLLRPLHLTRHEPGTDVKLDLGGIWPPWHGLGLFRIDAWAGGGVTGQVYKATLLATDEADEAEPPVEIDRAYALRVFVPWSRPARWARNAVHALAFQAPYALQGNADAVRAVGLWHKIIRRASSYWFGDERIVADAYAMFHDETLGSLGLVLEWVEGRTWQIELDPHLFNGNGKIAAAQKPSAGEPSPSACLTEYAAKKAFMRSLFRLMEELGAEELARQYRWWNLTGQTNILKRAEANGNPSSGLTAVDLAQGLPLLPLAPMNPADVGQIARGLRSLRLVQFNRGHMGRLEAFANKHHQLFRDLHPAINALRFAESSHHCSQIDVLHRGPTAVLTADNRASLREGWLDHLHARGRLDPESARRLHRRPVRAWLYLVLGLLPLVGGFFQRLIGHAGFRQHVGNLIRSLGYLRRTLRARQCERLIDWHRQGRADEDRTDWLLEHPLQFWAEALGFGLLPASVHRFFTDSLYARGVVERWFVRPWQFCFDPEARQEMVLEAAEDWQERDLLPDEDAAEIRRRVDEPQIQAYISGFFVHLATLPAGLVLAALGAAGARLVAADSWADARAWAAGVLGFFSLTPVSPGSLIRGGYVLVRAIRARSFRDYRLALALAFCKWGGWLAFPAQMAASYPVLSRFLAGRAAMGLVRKIPVLGRRGALPEYLAYRLCYNVPLGAGRWWRRWPKRDAWVRRVGTLLGLGRLPGAPGAYVSLPVAAALAGLAWVGCPWWPVLLAAAGLAAAGIVTAGLWERSDTAKRRGSFVLDAVVGQCVAGLAAWLPWPWLAAGWPWPVPPAVIGAALAFVWFRLMVVARPRPVRAAGALQGGWGTVGDDLVAGAIALALVAACQGVLYTTLTLWVG